MRNSVDSPSSPTLNIYGANDISDAAAVDDTPGFFAGIFNFLLKIWWIIVILLGLAAISFPYLFPEWADKHKNALVEMGIAANTVKFVENAKRVDFLDAFSKSNIRSLHLVGTGLHPQYKADPALKAGTWYTGQGFIMKGYVTEKDWLTHNGANLADNHAPDLLMPATDIEQNDAAGYCAAKGGRLPNWEELRVAYYFAFTKKWQDKVGNFLKPNLKFGIKPNTMLWTSTREGDGYTTKDNFQVYIPGSMKVRFEDDGFQGDNLSFLCIKDEAK